MSGDILTVKTVKRVRSVRGSALVHIMMINVQTFRCETGDFVIVYLVPTSISSYLNIRCRKCSR